MEGYGQKGQDQKFGCFGFGGIMKKKNQGGVEHCFAISEDGQPVIEGLEKVKNLQVSGNLMINLQRLGLRKNLIKKIEGIETCHNLVELELYDNKISKLENLNHLKNLTFLDLAFNVIKEVTPGSLDGLTNLRKLYLSANKIKKI